MPHARLWRESDWDFAVDTAALAARFYESNGTALAAELRQRERILGTTADARRDLRVRHVPVRRQELATVHQADDYQGLLGRRATPGA